MSVLAPAELVECIWAHDPTVWTGADEAHWLGWLDEPVRMRERGLPLAVGLGPRYLHSTGQLHRGGPDTVIAVQVVDDPGDELPIPGREFGFRRLIRAQAAGDYEALRERGRRVCRIRL